MATPAAPVSASSDRTNYFRVCRVVLDHIPKVLREVFKDEFQKQYGYPWIDGVPSGTWLRGKEKWTRKIGSEQKKLLYTGNSAEWDPTLLFHILLFSSLCLFVEEIPGTTFKPGSKQIVAVSLPGSLGNKVIIQSKIGNSIHIVEIITSSATCLQLDRKERILALPNAKVYRCKSEWYVVDRLRVMRNKKFAHVKAASISDSDFKQFVMDVENAYTKLLGQSGSRGMIAELKQIETEEIIDPATKRKYRERMELEAKRYEELAHKLQEHEQQITEHGELITEHGEQITEHRELITEQGEQIKEMEMERKSTERKYRERMELEDKRYEELAHKLQEHEQQITEHGEPITEQGELITEQGEQIKDMRMDWLSTDAIRASDIRKLEERLGCIEGTVTQTLETEREKIQKNTSVIAKIDERLGSVEEQVAQQAEDMSIQKSEHEKMASTVRTVKRKVEQIDKKVTQQGGTLARLEQQLNTKLQREFTSKTLPDETSRHRCTITYTKGRMRTDSEYFCTEEEAEEQASQRMDKELEKSRSITVPVSRSVPETLPHILQLEEYLVRNKLGGKTDTKSCKGGYQSTVFVSRSGAYPGRVCRSRERAEDDAACHALQELGEL